MKFDCHMHTPLCGHAIGTPLEFLKAAKEKGLKLITITCHVPIDLPEFGGPRIRMPESEFPNYLAWVNQAREIGQAMGIDVLYGIEGEIFPENHIQSRIGDFITKENFDYVLGSLHHQLPSYRNHIDSRGRMKDSEIIEGYFLELCEGARTGIFHSIAHPDVIRIYGTVQPFDPSDYEKVIREFLKVCHQTDTCIEVNTSGLTKGIFEIHPDPIIMKWAKEEEVELTIGSDAHMPQSVGQFFDKALNLIKIAGHDHLNYFLNGKRKRIDISAMA